MTYCSTAPVRPLAFDVTVLPGGVGFCGLWKSTLECISLTAVRKVDSLWEVEPPRLLGARC